jgi:hypothetical protein
VHLVQHKNNILSLLMEIYPRQQYLLLDLLPSVVEAA